MTHALAALVAVLLLASSAHAAVHIAASCSRADVDAKALIAVDGDTIEIPAGTCAWTTAYAFGDKTLYIKGAGIDVTTIQNNVFDQDGAGGNAPGRLWTFSPGANKKVRVSHLTFTTTLANGSNYGDGVLGFVCGGGGVAARVRVHHVKFQDPKQAGMKWSGVCYALADNGTSNVNFKTLGYVFHDAWGGGSNGDGSWAAATNYGTEQAVYVEDWTHNDSSNTLGTGILDSFNGGRWVVRYSTIIGSNFASHGTDSGLRQRSQRSFEAYNNVVKPSSGTLDTGFYLRGGTGVMYSNTFGTASPATGYTTMLKLEYDRVRDAFYPWGKATVSSITRSGSTATVTTSAPHNIGGSLVGGSIAISGANESDYNGTFTIQSVPTTTTLTYTVGGTPATPATGTITMRGNPGACDGTSPLDNNDGTVYASGTHTGANGATILTDSTKSFTTNQWLGTGESAHYSIRNVTKGWGSRITANTATTVTRDGSIFGATYIFDNGDSYQILRAAQCIDQVGRGQGDSISGTPPSPAVWPNQALEPVRAWSNTRNNTGGVGSAVGERLQVNRDWYVSDDNAAAQPAYTAFTYPHPFRTDSFLGDSGGSPAPAVGRLGTRFPRP